MSLFKCKMCGGDLEIAEGVTIAECEYCGTKQTVPKAMDENLKNLFNRANTLRIKSEFDKAEKLYEKIIQADSTQSEAYWGLILCKYGIEYVDDPATYKKIPTCHRASYDSIIADDDYKLAIENADMSQRIIYEEQAKEIDRIQKEILALAQKEENYDVFICYKETDADGRRTQDSVIANDIYYQLTQEGFKVFYAAITLEGKLGSAYEPIIFAALNSAKVMLSIGTRPEYFNSVWVKNEWSRFLKIIKKDRSKLLIPCYRDMDAYELPEEFAHLQAQDMSKIGFINDLVRGIKKVINKDESKPTRVLKETLVSSGAINVTPLLKRAFIFLEDGEWERADDFCEQILNQDPENAAAYLAKLMAELNVKRQDELKEQAEPFDNRNNYQKAVRFADEKLKATLIGDIEHINTRNENARLDGIYVRAKRNMSLANSERAYKEAAQLFESIAEYRDSSELAQICYENAEISRKDTILSSAKSKANAKTVTSLEEAIKLFASIEGWRDADEQLLLCQNQLEALKERIKAINVEKAKQAEKRKKRNKKIAIIVTPILVVAIAFICIFNAVYCPHTNIYTFRRNGVKATCTETGSYDSVSFCLDCRREISLEKVTVPATHETHYRQENRIEATCTEEGRYDLVAYCSVCNVELLRKAFTITQVPHKPSAVEENRVEATCTEEGRYDSVVYCSVCNLEISRKTVATPRVHNIENGFCTLCGIEIYTRDGNYIYFGEYPQTLKADSVTITSTQDSRGYYLGSDGFYYAKVVASPYGSGYTFSMGATVLRGTTYYFKVEPIRWRILSEDGETAFILCDSIIANHRYDDSSNNYADSEIRQWLNETFYATAFTEIQKQLILTTTVDNSIGSTGFSSNDNACDNTDDKIFLLSYREVIKSAYGFSSDSSAYDEARRMQTSDYSRAMGVYLSTSSSGYGNGYWWLRSPQATYRDGARIVGFVGHVDTIDGIDESINGVVPALRIKL